MAKKGGREIVSLVCTVCKSQNYITQRNKINMELSAKKGAKLELKKFCNNCKKIQPHKESVRFK